MEDEEVVGSCTTMCPWLEELMRQKYNRVHRLEQASKGDQNPIMVKEFSRAAAGKKISLNDLRPSDVLLRTTFYLVNRIMTSPSESFHVIYNFIFDRLRAIRQDICLQRLKDGNVVTIYEVIVRFLIYSGYRLCDEEDLQFDPTINRSHLQECLKHLLLLYEDTVAATSAASTSTTTATTTAATNPTIDNTRMDDIIDGFNDINIDKNCSSNDVDDIKCYSVTSNGDDADNIHHDNLPPSTEKHIQHSLPSGDELPLEGHHDTEFIKYYMLLNLGNADALQFAACRMHKYASDTSFRRIFELSKSWFSMKNYQRIMTMLRRSAKSKSSSSLSSSSSSSLNHLTPLEACLLHVHMDAVRINCLEIMCRAYNSKTSTCSLADLCEFLCYDLEMESSLLKDLLDSCQIDVSPDGGVVLNKAKFKMPVKITHRRSRCVDGLLDGRSLPSLILANDANDLTPSE